MAIKLLLVEDDQGDREGFERSVKRFNHETGTEFVVVSFSTLDETLEALDSSFDCAVIDMKLGETGGEGNEILKALNEANVRMPIVILTGTPGEADDGFVHIEVQKKGEADHLDILEDFRQVHASGLTKVMGGRGLLEQSLSHVFRSNLLSQKESWKKYGQQDPEKSEKALMRHVMNHLIQLVDLDEESCVPEEFYIFPPIGDLKRTGTVLKSKENGSYFAVMNPLCDLTVRPNGEFKARHISFCKISSLDECAAHEAKSKENVRKELEKNKRNCYHFLPATAFFEGGFMDFESLMSVEKEEVQGRFEAPLLQISPAFMKDVVSRFSSFYGRQGQPTLTYAVE